MSLPLLCVKGRQVSTYDSKQKRSSLAPLGFFDHLQVSPLMRRAMVITWVFEAQQYGTEKNFKNPKHRRRIMRFIQSSYTICEKFNKRDWKRYCEEADTLSLRQCPVIVVKDTAGGNHVMPYANPHFEDARKGSHISFEESLFILELTEKWPTEERRNFEKANQRVLVHPNYLQAIVMFKRPKAGGYNAYLSKVRGFTKWIHMHHPDFGKRAIFPLILSGQITRKHLECYLLKRGFDGIHPSTLVGDIYGLLWYFCSANKKLDPRSFDHTMKALRSHFSKISGGSDFLCPTWLKDYFLFCRDACKSKDDRTKFLALKLMLVFFLRVGTAAEIKREHLVHHIFEGRQMLTTFLVDTKTSRPCEGADACSIPASSNIWDVVTETQLILRSPEKSLFLLNTAKGKRITRSAITTQFNQWMAA